LEKINSSEKRFLIAIDDIQKIESIIQRHSGDLNIDELKELLPKYAEIL